MLSSLFDYAAFLRHENTKRAYFFACTAGRSELSISKILGRVAEGAEYGFAIHFNLFAFSIFV
jgi:hypothetical protein